VKESHPAQDRLNAYLLDELDDAVRNEVETHLQNCARCREKIAPLNDALKAYRTSEHAPPPDRILSSLRSVQTALRPADSQRVIWRPVSALAACVAAAVIFLGGYWLGQANSLPRPAGEARHTVTGDRRHLRGDPPKITFNATAADRLQGVAFPDSTPN
jgi:anti-sigma factor RsiW